MRLRRVPMPKLAYATANSEANFGIEGGAGNFTIAVWSLDLKVRTYVRCNGRNFKSFARGLSRNPIRSR